MGDNDVVCPYACGWDPYELTCSPAVEQDAGLPWWRRIIRSFAGRHGCPHFNRELPCERYNSSNKEIRA